MSAHRFPNDGHDGGKSICEVCDKAWADNNGYMVRRWLEINSVRVECCVRCWQDLRVKRVRKAGVIAVEHVNY